MSSGSATAALLLAFAVSAHNVEEMIWLPRFRHPPWLRLDISAAAFRFAATVVAAIFWLSAAALAVGWQIEAVIAGLALAMIVNAFVPHLALTVFLRRYHPGTATAWLAVVPAALLFLAAAGAPAAFADARFVALAAAGASGLAASLPVLLALGRVLTRKAGVE